MSKTVALPPLPASITDPSTGPKTAAFGPIFVSLTEQINALLVEFGKIRDAKSNTQGLLDESSAEEAVAYRALVEKAAVKKDEIKAEYKPQLDEIANAIKERTSKIDAKVKEARDLAVKAVIGDVVTEADPEALAKQLVDLNSSWTAAKNVLLDENPALKGVRVVSPNQASGKSNVGGESGTKRPRLSSILVNGVEVTPAEGKAHPTSSDAAKVAGVKVVANLNKALFDAIGNIGEIPTDHYVEFSLDVNGKNVDFAFKGRESESAEDATPELVNA